RVYAPSPSPRPSPTRRSSDLRQLRQGPIAVERRLGPRVLARPDVLEDLQDASHLVVAEVRAGVQRGEPRSRGRLGVLECIDDRQDRKSTRLNSSHGSISYAVL